MEKINNFKQAEDFLHNSVPRGITRKFPGLMGIKRTKYFLKLLDNPQEKIKTIHIAGTSGKGSTAYLLSLMLTGLGFKTGLSISPHLTDIRERIQLNNKPISKKKFIYYLNLLLPFIKEMKKKSFGPPTYFEIMISLAFFVFYKEKVNWAIIETGMGGLYDATNTINNKNKTVILTKIGIDHTNVLGKKLKEIANQKAGIIKPNNQIICLWQHKNIRKVIKSRAKKNQLYFIKKGINFNNLKINRQQTVFDFNFLNYNLNEVKLGLIGSHQAENCSLALATIILLSNRYKFKINDYKIKKYLKKAFFSGRLEIINLNNQIIVLDGAHNPQKITNLTNNLKLLFPNQKFIFLLAFKRGKDYQKMLDKIAPLAKDIVLTKFNLNQDYLNLAESPEKIKKFLLASYNFKATSDNNPKKALLKAKSLGYNCPIVITGSLYLLGTYLKKVKNLN